MGEEGDKTLRKTLKKRKVKLISQTLHGVAKMKKIPGRKSISHTLNELARKRKMKNVRKPKQQTLGNSATMTIGIEKRQIPHFPENVVRTKLKKGAAPILHSLGNIARRKMKAGETTPQIPRKGALMKKSEKVASIRMKARRVALIKTTRNLSAGKKLRSVVSDVSINDNVENINEENSDTKIDYDDAPLLHDSKSPPAEVDNDSKFLRKTSNDVMRQVGKGYIPRSTRSQNPKFVEKQRSFLKKVHSMVSEDIDEESDSDTKEESKEPLITNIKLEDAPKTIDDDRPAHVGPDYDEDMAELRRRSPRKEITMAGRKDKFCWKCHKEEKEVLSCELCPRSYHLKCVLLRERPQEAWVCPECVLVTHADDEASRSTNMRMMTLKEQQKILQNVVKMMKDVKLADNFFEHVNTTEFPDYLQFIVKPMCISTLEEMVDNREITSTQGLFAETKWIHHNCVVYNGLNAGLTGVAKALKKICRDECIKIEICPECFLHTCRHGAKGFIRVCKRPHVPVWARMTGFPFWPAKAMGMKDGGVQVFFFADHNRAVVPSSEVFLYSQDIPFPNQRNSRKQRLEDAVEEMKQHLTQLMKKEYTLKLAPCQTPYDPNRDEEHRRMMLPNYVEWVPQKRSRTKIKSEKLSMHLKDTTNEDGNSMVHLKHESTHLDSSRTNDKSLMTAPSKAKKKRLLQRSKSPSSSGSDMKRRRKTISPKPNSKEKVIPEGETAVNVILEKEKMVYILDRKNYCSDDFNCNSDKPLQDAKHCKKRKCETDYGSKKSAKSSDQGTYKDMSLNVDTIKLSNIDIKTIMRDCKVLCEHIKKPKIFASEQTKIIQSFKSKTSECSKPIVDDTSVDRNNDSSDCASNDNSTLSLSDTPSVTLLSSSRNSTNSNETVSEKNSSELNNFDNGEISKIDSDINNISSIKTRFDSVSTKTTVQPMSRVTGENCESLLLGASKPELPVPIKETCPESSADKVLENSDKAFINGSVCIPKETSIDSDKKSPNVMLAGEVTSELSSGVKTAPTTSSSVDKEDITVHLKTTNNIKTSEKLVSGCRTAANDGDSNSMELIEIKKELIDECEMDGDILSPPSKDTALMVYSPMLEPKISLTVLNEQVHTDSPTTGPLMTERLLSVDPISKEISFALSPEVNLFLQPSTKISNHNNEVSSDSLGQQHLQIGSPPASPQPAIKRLSDKKTSQPGSPGAETAANGTGLQPLPNGTNSQPLPNNADDPKRFPSLKIPLNRPSLLPNLLMNYYPDIANPKTPEDVKMLTSLSYEVDRILIGLEAFQNKTSLPNGISKKSNLHEYKDSILELLLKLVLYDNERNINLQTSETVYYNYLYNENPLYYHTDHDKTKCLSQFMTMEENHKSLPKECQRQIEDAKKKLWCSFCSKEACMHCCLKAAYCNKHCQAQHRSQHYEVCTSSGLNTLNRKHPVLNPTPLSQVRTNCEYDTGSPKGRWRNKRRRCGLCEGCLVLDNCGLCSVCINPNTHQVCKLRQCSHLQHKSFNPSVDKLPPLLPAYPQTLPLPKTNGSIPRGSKKPRKKAPLHDMPPDMRLRTHTVSNSNMMQIQSYEQPPLHLSTQFGAIACHFNVLEAQRSIANNSGFGIQNGLVNQGALNVSRALHDNEGNYPNIHPGRSSDHWLNPYCVPPHNGRMFPSHRGQLIVPPPDNLNVQSFPNSHGPLNVSLPQEGGPNTSTTLISSSSLVKHNSTKLSSSNTSTTLNHMERSMLNYLPSYPHPSLELKPQHSLGPPLSANQPPPNYGVPPQLSNTHQSNTHQSMGSRPTLPNPQYSMELVPKLPNQHHFRLPDPRQLMGHPIQNFKGPPRPPYCSLR